LCGAQDVRLDAGVIRRPPFSRASHAGLDFISDQQNAVLAAEFLEPAQKFRWSDDIAAFALNRLNENRGDFLGIDDTLEEFSFNMREGVSCGVLRANSVGATIGIGVGSVENAAEQRTKMMALNGLAGGERK